MEGKRQEKRYDTQAYQLQIVKGVDWLMKPQGKLVQMEVLETYKIQIKKQGFAKNYIAGCVGRKNNGKNK